MKAFGKMLALGGWKSDGVLGEIACDGLLDGLGVDVCKDT